MLASLLLHFCQRLFCCSLSDADLERVSSKALYPAIAKVFALTIAPTPDCKQYLEAVQPYLDLFNPSIPAIQASIKPEHSAFWTEWLVSTVKLWTPCRDKGTQ